jgi:hypothetical protein
LRPYNTLTVEPNYRYSWTSEAPGATATGDVALTTSDVLGPSEAMRKGMDYFAHAPNTRAMLERFASLGPKTLACMHGSAWSGDGAALLRALADRLEATS